MLDLKKLQSWWESAPQSAINMTHVTMRLCPHQMLHDHNLEQALDNLLACHWTKAPHLAIMPSDCESVSPTAAKSKPPEMVALKLCTPSRSTSALRAAHRSCWKPGQVRAAPCTTTSMSFTGVRAAYTLALQASNSLQACTKAWISHKKCV